MKAWIAVAAAFAVATGTACGAPPGREARQAVGPAAAMTPAQAIAAAASRPDDGAEGVFSFSVKSVGGGRNARSVVFLNSAADYHDAANLSVMIRPAAAKAIAEKLGGRLSDALAGKRVTVRGVARQARIDIYEGGEKTGRSYVQTRIEVTDAGQVTVG